MINADYFTTSFYHHTTIARLLQGTVGYKIIVQQLQASVEQSHAFAQKSHVLV